MIPRYPLAVIILFTCFLALSALPLTGREQVQLTAIHCPYCGAEVVAKARFCPKCGSQIPEITSIQRPEKAVPEETAVLPAPLRPLPAAEQAAVPAAEIAEQPTKQAADSRTQAAAESTMKSITPLPDVGDKLREMGSSAATPAEDILARNIYQMGMGFYERGTFLLAAERFSELLVKYPQSRYAEDARIMAKVCRGFDAIEKKMELKSGQAKHTGSAFIAGCLGGVVSIIAFAFLMLGASD